MSDGLDTWAGRPVDPPRPAATPPGRRRSGLPAALAAAGVAVLVLGAGLLAGRGRTDGEVAAPPAVQDPPSLVEATAPDPVPADPVDHAEPADQAAAAEQAAAEQAAAPGAAPPQPAQEPPPGPQPLDYSRMAVFRQGKVYLRGSIQSRELADRIIAKAGAVVGPHNVVDEYVIDPSVPYQNAAPLFVEDRVLFAFGSDHIEPDFYPLLELGMVLLSQNPQVTITVIGHTDTSGSVEFNQKLSERRVASVIRYFTDRGIDPARFTADARGKSEPLVPTGDNQREPLNRRVEFIITGLLGGA